MRFRIQGSGFRLRAAGGLGLNGLGLRVQGEIWVLGATEAF